MRPEAMGAYGVEVAQKYDGKLGVCPGGVFQNLFHHELRPSVGVGAAAARHGFHVGVRVFLAVHGGGGGEHNVVNAALLHAFQQRERGVDVVAIVFDGLAHGFSHRLHTGKMHHAVHGICLHDEAHGVAVAHVRLVCRDGTPGKLLDSFDDFGGAVAVVVHNNDIVTGGHEFHGRVRTDVTGAACKKNNHKNYL